MFRHNACLQSGGPTYLLFFCWLVPPVRTHATLAATPMLGAPKHADMQPAPGGRSRPAQARVWTGGEEKRPQTGDDNTGYNYLVRGYSPFMHFFGEVTCPFFLLPALFGGAERGSVERRACAFVWPARGQLCLSHGLERCPPRPGAGLSARPCTPSPATAPRFSPVYAPVLVELYHPLTNISV